MKESFIDRAKADGKVFVKTVSLLSKLSKLKVDIVAKQKERKQVLGLVGTAVYEIYQRSNAADGGVIAGAVSNHIDTLRRLDAELANLETEVQHTKSSFKQADPGQPGPPAGPEEHSG